ncbi:hypothetical protein LI328DRAFT_171378 [Trichoderma asperelloides]|nr:hypothetical protein LI328DRAFT_171378 [Trichoderma asperelloides]
MSRFAIFAGLMAVSVAAQAEFAAPGFKYIGCVEAEPAVFNAKADLPAPFSVQQCQDACHAKGKYAAMDGSCNCYDSSSKAEPSYNILDESVCSLPCIGGNRTAGVCGGPQCEVTGKKRYSLYKQEVEHHDGDDYDKEDKQELKYHDGTDYEKDKTKETGIQTKYITSTVKTITACPPEVTNCPLSPNKTIPQCPGEGCHIPTTSADPAKPTCPEKCSPPCPPEGCAACPPGGCLPVCPPGCPHPPACDGEHCKIGLPPSLACPSGGCFHPHPTVIVSEGTRYQSGVLIALAAAAMAVGWL